MASGRALACANKKPDCSLCIFYKQFSHPMCRLNAFPSGATCTFEVSCAEHFAGRKLAVLCECLLNYSMAMSETWLTWGKLTVWVSGQLWLLQLFLYAYDLWCIHVLQILYRWYSTCICILHKQWFDVGNDLYMCYSTWLRILSKEMLTEERCDVLRLVVEIRSCERVAKRFKEQRRESDIQDHYISLPSVFGEDSLNITCYHLLSLVITCYHLLSLVITCYHLLSLVITCYHLLSFVITCYHLLSLVIICYHMLSLVITCYHLFSLVVTCYHLLSLVIICYHLLSLVITCYHLLSLVITCYHLLSRVLTCYHLLSLAITCYHLLSLVITCYHLLSLVITCYHMLSLVITCYHLLSLVINCYHMLSLVITCYHLLSLVIICYHVLSQQCCHHLKTISREKIWWSLFCEINWGTLSLSRAKRRRWQMPMSTGSMNSMIGELCWLLSHGRIRALLLWVPISDSELEEFP